MIDSTLSKREATDELSPPNFEFPHVTTVPSDFKAANAVPVLMIDSTSTRSLATEDSVIT